MGYLETLTLTDADVEYVYRAAKTWHEYSGRHTDTESDRERFARHCAGYARHMDTMDVHFPSMYRVWR